MGAALYNYYTHGELKAEGESITEGIGQGRITANLEGAPVDRAWQITDAEALPIVFDLLEHEGLCLGGSSGINVAGAIRLARELGPGHVIVTVLCDYGTRYQSKLFDPAFLRSKDLPVPGWLDAAVMTGETGPLRSIRMACPPSWRCRRPHRRRQLPSAGGRPRTRARNSSVSTFPARSSSTSMQLLSHSSGLPHMLPSPVVFAERVGALGIGSADTVVVYDAPGSAAAARVWWTFRVFGHDRVVLLDGGLARWLAEGRPIESGRPAPRPLRFRARLQPRTGWWTGASSRPGSRRR